MSDKTEDVSVEPLIGIGGGVTFKRGLMKAAGTTVVAADRLAALEAVAEAARDLRRAEPFNEDEEEAQARFDAALAALDGLTEEQQPNE